MTAALNQLVPGDANTFAATFSPPGTPAPAPGPTRATLQADGATVQLPILPPDPNGGLVGLLFRTG